MTRPIILATLIAASPAATAHHSWVIDLFDSLRVEQESRCESDVYSSRKYPYSAKVEHDIVRRQGRIYGPYEARTFASIRDTDIEHIVARSEAHHSGLCGRPASEKRRYANDLENLTLASPEVNRCRPQGKCGKDASEWMPRHNRCWYAAQVITVKWKYDLSVDQAERNALRRVVSQCSTFEMQ